MRAAAIQMNSSADVTTNLLTAGQQIAVAALQGADLVVLPENFALMTQAKYGKLDIAENLKNGPIQHFLSEQAIKNNIYIVGGTIPIKSHESNRVYNSCIVYNNAGEQIAYYHKIHLFDAAVIPESEVYTESETIIPGNQTVVIDTTLGRLGLAICYDIRFPELFRELTHKGAEIIVLPAAFTLKTGKAHWEILMRARAIENFCFMIGACQTGAHEGNRQTYGHSMIVHPWGTILATLDQECGYIIANLSLDDLNKIRADFPVHLHRKL